MAVKIFFVSKIYIFEYDPCIADSRESLSPSEEVNDNSASDSLGILKLPFFKTGSGIISATEIISDFKIISDSSLATGSGDAIFSGITTGSETGETIGFELDLGSKIVQDAE